MVMFLSNQYVIGIDIGATWTRIALAKTDGSIANKYVFRTPREGDRYTIANTIISNIRREFSNYLDNVKAIGIGTIGPLDLAQGIVINPSNVAIRTFEVAKPILEEFRKPVIMANDCVTAVWGEKHFGLGRGYSNIVYITISTGIGGGIIVDDTLLLGKMGNAHEIGHIVVDASGKMECGCGGKGHWEAYASGANIPKFAYRLIDEWSLTESERSSPIYRAYLNRELTSELIYTYAKKGDSLALRIVNEVNKYNIAGFENVINSYDPEIITVGGSVALRNSELVIEPIVRGIENSKGVVTARPRIDITPLGDDIVLLGALALALYPPPNLVKKLKYLESISIDL